MALPLAENSRARCRYVWKSLLLASPLVGISLTGCNDTCFTFTSNPPTGTVNVKAGDPKPTCMLTKANGAVRVLTRTARCESCPPSTRIAHLFVSLRGIEVHPSAIADDASPDWHELMQGLPGQAPRFDLIGVASGGAPLPLGEVATIPADAYRQVRLRFAPGQRTSDDFGLGGSACGGATSNCVVLEDGRAYPLLFHGAPSELRITSASLAGGFLLIPPDSNSNLVIEIGIAWTFASGVGEGRRLLPVLSGSASVERRPAQGVEER
jgi:hypothetical protein